MRWLLRPALWLLGLLLVLGLLAYLFQRKLQYFPDASAVVLPRGERWKDLENVTLEAADGTRLEASFWNGTRRTALLLLHGNAGHRGDRFGWMEPFHRLGYPVLLLDYRGYGGSGGSPSEAGLVQDGVAAFDWLREKGYQDVVLFGESIGCGVAVLVATKRRPRGLVLQSGAISITEVAARAYPFLPVRWFLRDRFELADAAARIDAPALVVHGDEDEIVPLELGRALHDALGGETAWFVVDGAGHNDVEHAGGRAYRDRVAAFLAALSD